MVDDWRREGLIILPIVVPKSLDRSHLSFGLIWWIVRLSSLPTSRLFVSLGKVQKDRSGEIKGWRIADHDSRSISVISFSIQDITDLQPPSLPARTISVEDTPTSITILSKRHSQKRP